MEKVYVGKYLFILGEHDQTDKDLRRLIKIVKAEESHLQWWPWTICIFEQAILVLMNLALPTKTRESPIGVSLCGAWFWIIQIAFLVFCALMLVYTIWHLKREQALKIKYGNVNICESDIIYNNKNVSKLVALGFFGGVLAAALGLGGGIIFNPVLLSLGVPPQASGAISLYLVFYGKVASCLVYVLNGQLNIMYSLWVGLWASVGGVIGSAALIIYIKFKGRQSTIVFILVLEFIVAIVLIPYFGVNQVLQTARQGTNVWAASSVCA